MTSVIRPAHANIVGYVNLTFQTGANWFANPLLSTAQGGDSLDTIIPTAPDGTTVSLWNSSANQFTTTSTFDNGAWSDNLVLDPGTGALLTAPSQFVNIFVGDAENFDGTIPTGGDITGTPPVFSGPNGVYFLASKGPVALSGSQVLEDIIGRGPQNGEQVTTLNALTQTYTTSTFLNGTWNNGDPTLAVGGAAMINIGPAPEPSSVALMLAGLASVFALRRRQVSKA
ncbi:MAG TPA: PEP-CTERM sorting domain-containing protein [Verrucomicrobiae bacterium]|nr:PEP-CTERM sorting domain-containing protein [Verrucomicrobiae bacterium]